MAGSAAAPDQDGTGRPDRPAGDRRAGRILRRPAVLLASAVAVVAVALLVVAILQSVSLRHSDAVAGYRSAAVGAARQEVLDLTTLSAATAPADVKRLLDGATAEFRDRFAQQATAFQTALAQGEVTSTGTTTSAGLVSLDGDTATVIVAATATVKNTQSPRGAARSYRFTVTVRHVGARWLVSSLTFVV
ncbi:MAG: hypothetical protein ACR2LF_12240 [Jatrophihabitantaceae bacterium]